jgi:hypothetical protein
MSDQIENNKKILASLRNDDANRDHIWKRCWKRVQAIRMVTVMRKRNREDEQKALTNAELYLDDWAFHRGGITKANMQEALADCIDRVLKQHQAKRQRQEQAEWRAMQGPLASEFADFHAPFGDLPGDADFEAEILKEHPELKDFKR